jgi:translation initiation factor IF-2
MPVATTVSPSTTTTTTIAPQLEELQTLVNQGLNDEQATELATNPEVLEVATAEVAEEIFAAIDEEALTPESGLAIVEALASASEEVREAFEKEIDIFAGNTDTYVPVGSSIPVSQRRSIIAISAVMAMTPIPTRRK